MKTRKVSFYKISLDYEDNKKTSSPLSNREIQEIFISIYENNMQPISQTGKAISIKTLNKQVVLEVMKYNDSIVFAKIGQENNANTVGLRDSKTLKTEDVPMTSTQQLELYTYCLIDFENCIISYIGINGAPKIGAIKYLFREFVNENINVHLDSILTDDIIKQLSNKSIIGGIRFSIAVPPDSILDDSLQLTRREFDNYRNINRTTVEYFISAKRNQNMFVSSSYLSETVFRIREKFGDAIKGIFVKAKNFGERMQEYNLDNYNFSKTVSLNTDKDDESLDESDFYHALKTTYDMSKAEIMRYVRNANEQA